MGDYVVWAVPVFISLMLFEFWLVSRRQEKAYRFNDTMVNLACGMGSQLIGYFVTAVVVLIYNFFYNHMRFMTLDNSSWLTWVIAMIGVDFCYYWYHRTSHVVNFLWAEHIVHHQSEEYNFSVALRQPWFVSAVDWLFFLPLAFLGVSPMVFLISYSLNLFYQFLLHTRAVQSLGILDWVLNTPSHHRVHHGTNRQYLDKNYGGMLIIWDRLFGSFIKEEEEVRYGIVKPLASWNPLFANLHYWLELIQQTRSLPGIGNKIKVWFKNPGWQPGDTSLEDARDRITPSVFGPHTPPLKKGAMFYVSAHLVTAVIGTVLIMGYARSFSSVQVVMLVSFVISTMVIWGGLFELRRWALRLEAARLCCLPFLVAAFIGVGSAPAVVSAAAFSLISLTVFVLLVKRGLLESLPLT